MKINLLQFSLLPTKYVNFPGRTIAGKLHEFMQEKWVARERN